VLNMVSPTTGHLNACFTNYFKLGSEELKKKKVEELSLEVIKFVEKQFEENQESNSFEFSIGDREFKTGVLSERIVIQSVKAAINDLHPDYLVETKGKFKISNFRTCRSSCKFKVTHLSS